MSDPGFNWEAWNLPTATAGVYTKKFDVTKAIESYEVNVRYSGLSDGSGQINRDFTRLPDLITVDKDNHANDVGSMLRLKRGTDYIRDFVFYRLKRDWDNKKATHDFILQGAEFLLDKARVRRYDHPRNPSTDPDWHYGAKTLINELGGERVREIHTIWTNATSGTWEIVFQGQTTDPLTIPTTASDIRTAMQDLSNVEDVDVTGTGISVDPWEITYVDPAGNVTLVTINNSTDGNFTVNELQQGGTLDARPWHRSYHPVTGILHGNYQQFAITETGALFPGTSYALVVDSDSLATPTDYSGAQVIENVESSKQYRAKVPVYCDGASLTIRLVVRDMQENLIAASPDQVIPANTWTWIELDAAVGARIPAGVTEVIYRIGIIESTNVVPLRIAIEEAVFAPGFEEDTVGAILTDVINQGKAFGDLDWITTTWTDTLDSAGVAWDTTREWKINHNQTFLQLLERIIKWGYEFNVYYDDGAGQWKWDIFNPGGGGQTITGLSLKGRDSIAGGFGTVTFPGATWFDAEGDAGEFGQYEDATLSTAWGRIQGAIADDQGLDQVGLADLAQTQVESATDGSEAAQVTLRNPEKLPFVDFFPGDSFEFDNSPIGEKRVRRCQLISIQQDAGQTSPTYQVHGDAITFTGESALAENVRTLSRKVDAIVIPRARERTWDPAMFNVGSETIGAGGTIPWLVVGNDAPDGVKDIAGYVCDGTNDEVEIQAAIDLVRNSGLSGGEVWLLWGNYNCALTDGDAAVHVFPNVTLRGIGNLAASGGSNAYLVQDTFAGYTVETAMIELSAGAQLINVSCEGYDGASAIRLGNFASSILIEKCAIFSDDPTTPDGESGSCIRAPGTGNRSEIRIRDCYLQSFSFDIAGAPLINFYGTLYESWIENNWIVSGGKSHLEFQRGMIHTSIEGNYSWSPGLQFVNAKWYTWGSRIVGNKVLAHGQAVDANQAYGAIEIRDSVNGPDELYNAEGELVIAHNSIYDGLGNNSRGIWIQDFMHVIAQSNIIASNYEHGIFVELCEAVEILDNMITTPDVQGDGSGIVLDDCTGVRVDRNRIIGGTVNLLNFDYWQYGIDVQAGCVDCIVTHNHLSSWDTNGDGTAPINDAGTGTILEPPTGGTYGSNYT